jgi:hypothetical protein
VIEAPVPLKLATFVTVGSAEDVEVTTGGFAHVIARLANVDATTVLLLTTGRLVTAKGIRGVVLVKVTVTTWPAVAAGVIVALVADTKVNALAAPATVKVPLNAVKAVPLLLNVSVVPAAFKAKLVSV